MDAYTPVALKLHAFGLQRLQDPNWTGMALYDELKRPVRMKGFLQTFQKEGFLYWLGQLLFRDYMIQDYYLEKLRGEYLVWYLEDFAEFLRFHGADKGPKTLARLEKRLDKIGELYGEDEQEYFRVVESERTRDKLLRLRASLTSKNEELIQKAVPVYAANYADRVFHDRELCAYLSQLIITIGFDGMDDLNDTEPKKWMERAAIPTWAKELVVARDRGLCAQCKTAITLELEADDHFDHMVPLSRGGCNDIVNLQLLCQGCNLAKSNNDVPIHSSIPPYMLRFHRQK